MVQISPCSHVGAPGVLRLLIPMWASHQSNPNWNIFDIFDVLWSCTRSTSMCCGWNLLCLCRNGSKHTSSQRRKPPICPSWRRRWLRPWCRRLGANPPYRILNKLFHFILWLVAEFRNLVISLCHFLGSWMTIFVVGQSFGFVSVTNATSHFSVT